MNKWSWIGGTIGMFHELVFPTYQKIMCSFYFILGLCFYIFRFLFFLDLCFCIFWFLVFFGYVFLHLCWQLRLPININIHSICLFYWGWDVLNTISKSPFQFWIWKIKFTWVVFCAMQGGKVRYKTHIGGDSNGIWKGERL